MRKLAPGRLVIASHNPGKVREMSDMLAEFDLEVVPQNRLGVPEAMEHGSTFVENALIKARHAAACTGLPAIADDSGLCVDALGGRPGIHSARFARELIDAGASRLGTSASVALVAEDERVDR